MGKGGRSWGEVEVVVETEKVAGWGTSCKLGREVEREDRIRKERRSWVEEG